MSEHEPQNTGSQADQGVALGNAETVAAARTPTPPASSAETTGLRKGDKLGRYMIVDELGRGGMGVVYTAFDPELDRKIALKVMRPGADGSTGGDERRARLKREAQAMAKISHPNVIHVYDVGELNDQIFIAMELVEGQRLRDWCKSRHSWREILRVFRAAGRGLDAAHEAGLVHRDFKPDNVLVGRDSRVRVLDFGLARAAGELLEPIDDGGGSDGGALDVALTETGTVVGTPAYMAPEQHRGDDPDARSDQFAFCVALWEALFGKRPFGGNDLETLAENAASGKLRDPGRTRVPDSVVRALRRGLSPEPTQRHSSMRPLLDALEIAPRRIGRTATLAAAVLLIVGAGAAYGIHRYRNRLITEHYATLTEVNGTPRGIGPVDGTARAHRGASWTLTHRRGRVLSVRRVSGLGRPAPDDSGASSWEYQYADGHLREIISRSPRGQVVARVLVSRDATRLERRDELDNPLPLPDTDASVIFRKLDDHGQVVEQRFANVYGAPRPDKRRAFGYRVSIGDAGLPTEWIALGADGEPTPTSDGIARVTRTYDGNGNVAEEHYYGGDGGPIRDADGAAGRRFAYDRWGNQTDETMLGPDSQPAPNRFGFTTLRTKYDAHGDAIALDYLDRQGNPVQPRGLMAARMDYDQHGNLIEELHVGVDGGLAPDDDGIAVIHHRYDKDDNLIETSTLDADRKPTLDARGSAFTRYVYDEQGNQIEGHYFDTNGKPAYIRDGYARFHAAFDARGQRISVTYLAPNGNQVRVPDGYSQTHWVYDERGRVRKESYLDPLGKPTPSSKGYATVRTRYDEHGNPIELSYFNTRDKPTLNSDGIAVEKRVYDDHGNLSRASYFDAAGKPTLHKNGYAAVARDYDSRGLEISGDYFGTTGAPTRCQDGYASYRREYDERGRLMREWYLGPDGKPTINAHGYHELRRRYDERGNAIEESYADDREQPTLSDEGYARVERSFDAHGNVVEMSFFDTTGKPTVNELGAADVRYELNSRGDRTAIRAFDVHGKPAMTNDWYATLKLEYDGLGHRIRRAHYNEHGKLMLNGDGFAVELSTYDHRGNLVVSSYLGTDEKPITTGRGFAYVRRVYDERGREIKRTYLDVDSHPVGAERGVATIETAYDRSGRVSERRYFDTKGKPTLDVTGTAGTHFLYDNHGNQIETSFFDLDNKRAERRDGVAVLRVHFDAYGRPVEIAAYDHEDHLVVPRDGVAVTRHTYDDRGHMTEEAYFGPDDKPMLGRDGYATAKMEHDDRGREIRRSFYGVKGEPTETVQGVHALLKGYDERGNQVSLDAVDVAGKPTRIGTGPAGFLYIYEPPDRLVRIIGYDTRRQPIEGTTYMGELYVWRSRGDKLYFFDAGHLPVTDPHLRVRLGQRAYAMMVSYRMEQRRATEPALFDGVRGLVVMELPPDSQGATIGLSVGDILLRYDGAGLDSEIDLDKAMVAAKAKESVTLKVLRSGRQVELRCAPGPLGAILEPQ